MQRAQQYVGLRAVIVDHAQTAVATLVFGHELFAHFRDIGGLAANDEELALLDFGHRLEGPRLAHAGVEVFPDLGEQRLESLEVLAKRAVGDFLSRALVGGGPYMLQIPDVRCTRSAFELCHEVVVIHGIHRRSRWSGRTNKKPLAIKRCEDCSAFFKRAQPVQANRIETLEYVTVFAMLRSAAMQFDETLNVFEAGDDAFFLGRTATLLFRLGEVFQLGAEFIQIKVRHSGPHPCNERKQQRPRLSVSPKGLLPLWKAGDPSRA
ncbi:hypothetical protein CHKEEEPN_2280 [Methylorubrum podarium]|nr:hypothetical protein CHKEEEPN_2280 [Methylorubrum podarium]